MAMEMHVLPWIKDDVAIEIIGKMIGEQMEGIYKLVEEYKQAGYKHDSKEILADVRYQELLQRIGNFKQEIDQIYDGDSVEELYKKVDQEYVPHLNELNTTDPINGDGLIQPDNSAENSFAVSTEWLSKINKDKHVTPGSMKQVNNHH